MHLHFNAHATGAVDLEARFYPSIALLTRNMNERLKRAERHLPLPRDQRLAIDEFELITKYL